jgi:PAS domain-containing protein
MIGAFMPQPRLAVGNPTEPDYRIVFDLMPGMCLILDASFNIVAQNAEHARATLTAGTSIIGRWLFEVFPDNPDAADVNGVSAVRQSLLNVLRTRAPDVMPMVRYDVQPTRGGRFEARYWAITNTPILGDDGFVRWIINRAEDVTDRMAVARPGH